MVLSILNLSLAFGISAADSQMILGDQFGGILEWSIRTSKICSKEPKSKNCYNHTWNIRKGYLNFFIFCIRIA